MRVTRYLLKSVNIINIGLLGVVVFFFLFVILPLFHVNGTYVPPRVKPKADVREAFSVEKTMSPSLLDYAAIGDKNLFHPERRIPPVQQAEKPVPRPELILYGTIVTEGSGVAFIEDKKQPRTSVGRGRRQTVMKKGEVVGGFVLKEILEDRIVLARGGETMIVRLTEEGKQRGGDGRGAGNPPLSSPGGTPLSAASSGPVSASAGSAASSAARTTAEPPRTTAAPQVRRQILWQGKTIQVPGDR